jgi:2-polyprenyl-3-methyl-5-hydroxy-6-metoxy-1,4-benzoquinol methylase
MDLSARSHLPEAMDDPGLDEQTYRRCLNDLAALNRVTGTHRAALRWLQAAIGRVPAQAWSVLDVAYGQGDLLRAIATLASRRGWRMRLAGIDLNPRSALAARQANAAMPIDYRIGDVFEYRPEPRPDFIFSSQFFHHLDDGQIVRLLQWFDENAAKGWMVTDLHRHFLPYYGFRFLVMAMRWHRIVRDDGTISIARGFRRAEWQALLAQAGVQADVRWRFPFRYTVSRLK